jgi:hypothetical protein
MIQMRVRVYDINSLFTSAFSVLIRQSLVHSMYIYCVNVVYTFVHLYYKC